MTAEQAEALIAALQAAFPGGLTEERVAEMIEAAIDQERRRIANLLWTEEPPAP